MVQNGGTYTIGTPAEQCDDGNNVSGDGCSATCEMENFDLALRKTLSSSTPGPFQPGDTVTYDITVFNQGTVDATNIVVTDYIPSGMELADNTWTAVSTTQATKTIASLAAGQPTTLTITLKIKNPAPTGASYRNAAEISSAHDAAGNTATDCDSVADNTDGNTPGETTATGMIDDNIGSGCDEGGDEDDHDIADITVDSEVDLAISKLVNAEQVVDGQTVTFTINFSNEGDITADYVDVIDTLPRGYDFVSATLTSFTGSPANPSYTLSSGSNDSTIISYTDLVLDPGEGGTLKIVATVDDNYCPDLTNTVRIELSSESDLVETDLTNNSDTATTYCGSELTLDKQQKGGSSNSYTDNHITVEAGDTIRYRIVVGHSGAESDQLSLVDALPDEVTYEGNLDFTVASSSEDNLCDYDSGDHELTCEYFSLDEDEEAVLEFDVEVKSNVDASDTIINKVTLFQDDRYVDNDSVTASPEEGDPDGEITKEVDERDLEVGDRTDFDIRFTNVGDVDLVRYEIVDIWPGDYLALVCDDELYAEDENDDESDLEDCLRDELVIRHSDHGTLDNDNIDFSVNMASNGDIEITLVFDVDEDDEHRLEPRDYISFTLEGEALREKDHVVNDVTVDYEDENGNGGDDDDDDYVNITGGYGQCVEITAGTLYYNSNQEVYEMSYTCVADDTVEEIELDCGNGYTATDEDVDSLTAVCKYDEDSEYEVECRFNGERVASPACTDDLLVAMPEPPTPGYCGDGERQYYEQCDYNDPDNVGRGRDGCSQTCTTRNTTPVDPQTPFCQKYPNHPDCNPTTVGQLPSCLYVDSAESVNGETLPMSIMTDEVLPFWWAIDDGNTNYVSSCSEDTPDYSVIQDTMTCTFDLYGPNNFFRPNVSDGDCHNADLSTLFNGSFVNIAAFGADDGATIDLRTILRDAVLGEYKLKLSKFDYQSCKDGKQVTQTTEECCMVNFTVTKPYLIQQGLGTAKDYNTEYYGTLNPLEAYYMLDGSNTNFADGYNIDYTVVEASAYDGGAAVDNAIDAFVEKYEALAIGSSSNGYSKVPGKNILVYKGSGTIAASDISGMKTFTVIIDNPNAVVELSEDVTKTNAMYVIREGTLKIAKAAEEVNGIFVLDSDANLSSEKVRNTDSDFDWNTDGSLTINGVIVGGDDSVRALMESRRSVLR
ncbi:MAG: DUF11 domain-containing protein [Candidatus Peribacteria bacterium]|nr:MAG: DUF11 domain-containing protein [Candidatus Peribacteria bacterium]